jgi:membrane protein DedA with SNARE-associated domain
MGTTVIQGLSSIADFAPDLSWAAKISSLIFLPFAHEDLAIIFGGYIIVNDLLPISLVALSIYSGMVASDFALYGIGAGARHLPWLSRFAVDDRVRTFGDSLKRNVFSIVALCRVVPGIVFVAFVACGWARVSLARFTVASLLVSALYLPLMLYLVIVFGDALEDHLGLWAWPMLFLAIGATSFARKRIFAFGENKKREAVEVEVAADPSVSDGHAGMPALAGADRRVAMAERIPPMLFYLPLIFNWVRLGLHHRSMTLPTAANPSIPTGGMWGESKSSYFFDVSPAERKWIADFVVIKRGAGARSVRADIDRSERALADAGMDYPLIAKPDIGWHGHGVRRIENAQALHDYVARFPEGVKLILQRFVPYAGEAAVLYARLPGERKGRIVSLTFRYFPHVIGNGVSTVRELIRKDPRAQWKSALHLGVDPTHRGVDPQGLLRVPASGEVVQIALIGNQRAGALYHDARRHITPELEARVDTIAGSMPEFHYGRFDIRFSSVEALMRGEDFSIVEVNGIGGEAIDVWDPRLPVSEVYRRLADQQRLLFLIGKQNRARGFRPTKIGDFVTSLIRQTQLIRRYPASA